MPPQDPNDAADQVPLTEALVDHLGLSEVPLTAMEIALALRHPYPEVVAELDSLERLGIVVRRGGERAPAWTLG